MNTQWSVGKGKKEFTFFDFGLLVMKEDGCDFFLVRLGRSVVSASTVVKYSRQRSKSASQNHRALIMELREEFVDLHKGRLSGARRILP